MAISPIFAALEREWSHLGWVLDPDVVSVWATTEPLLADCPTARAVVTRCERRGEVEDSNAVVGSLLRLADHDHHAIRALLQAVLPGLATRVARPARKSVGHRPLPGWDSLEDLGGEMVAGALERINQLTGSSPPWPAAAIVGSTWRRVRTAASANLRAEQMTLPLENARSIAAPPERCCLGVLSAELSAAVERDSLRRQDAAVVYATRVLGFTPAEVASESGRDVRAVRAQSSRACICFTLGAAVEPTCQSPARPGNRQFRFRISASATSAAHVMARDFDRDEAAICHNDVEVVLLIRTSAAIDLLGGTAKEGGHQPSGVRLLVP